MEKMTSKTRVKAVPVKNSLIFSNSLILLLVSPTVLFEKYPEVVSVNDL